MSTCAITSIGSGVNLTLFRLRILYMPAVYAIISFFSYRFFRSYTYYDLIETGTSSTSPHVWYVH